MRTESPVVVDGKTVAIGAVAKTIKTDSKGIAQTAADVLPYGTYEIAEKDPSTGYLLNNEWKQTFQIRNYSSYLRKMALDGYCIQLDIPEIKKMISLAWPVQQQPESVCAESQSDVQHLLGGYSGSERTAE